MTHNDAFRSVNRLVFVLTCLILSTGVGAAQQNRMFSSKGALEIGGSFSYQYTSVIIRDKETYAYNEISFYPYIGYFIDDHWEIGINPLGLQRRWNRQDQSTLLDLLIAPSYNFSVAENVFPFIEAQCGYTAQINSFSLSALNTRNDGFSWGGRIGVKIVVAGSCLVNGGVQYQQITLTPRGEPERSGSNTLMVSTGITFWL